MSSPSKYTRKDFTKDFPDENACLEWLRWHRWPSALIECKKCKKATKHFRVKSRPSYSCQFCGLHVHPTAGTLFDKSTTSLYLWFQAIYLMSATRTGIPAKHLERELGVTYKTAWRMAHLIREHLGEGTITLSGEVEVDEAYFSTPKRKGEARIQGKMKNRRTIMGSVERKGKVVVRKIDAPDTKRAEDHIQKFVSPGATIYTDEFPIYNKLDQKGFTHKTINHKSRNFMQGSAHTQTIDGFWSLLKRSLGGAYHSVGAKHLQSYLDEYAFRYNHRKDDRPMFYAFLEQILNPQAERLQDFADLIPF